MASVLAIVAKAVFEELEERAPRAFVVGDVVPLDRYLSAHQALSPLADGGALFLVTVPPAEETGERLWLVAILESPSLEGAAWIAEGNTAPLSDVTALLPELRFASGRGLAPKPGALGRSLQTPRALSGEDEVRLRAVAHPTPGAAYQAAVLDIVGPAPKAKARKGAPPPSPAAPTRDLPLPWREALATLAPWATLSDKARRAVLTELVADLAAADPRWAFEVTSSRVGAPNLGALRHTPSGTELIVVPGGRFAMGFTADDALALWGAVPVAEGGPRDDDDDDDDENVGPHAFDGELAAARPAHVVTLKPFLLARRPTSTRSLVAAADLADGDHPSAALPILGWRLPSEAEWEWIAREGGAVRFVALPASAHPQTPTLSPPTREPSGWGFEGLQDEPQQVADAWHPDYAGAPADGGAWDAAAGPGTTRYGHTWWQSHEEAVALHVAHRGQGRGDLRLALDLPGALAPAADAAPFAWEATFAGALEALQAKAKTTRERGRRALLALAHGVGDDGVAFVNAVASGLGGYDSKATLPFLVALIGDLANARAEVAAALEPHADAVAALLDHADAKLRSAAAYALAPCAGRADALLPRLRARLPVEKKPEALASALLALGHLARAAGAACPELDAKYRQPLVTMAALIGKVVHAGPTDALLMALAEVLATPSVARDALPWSGGDLGAWAYRFITAAGPEARDVAARKLAALAVAAKDPAPLALGAMRLAFGPAPTDGDEDGALRDPASLGALERDVVTALSERELPVEQGVFSAYGIPGHVEVRRGWLGVDGPGASDREITVAWDGAPRTWPIWRWFEALKKELQDKPPEWRDEHWPAAVEAGLAALDPGERLALMLDYHRTTLQWEDEHAVIAAAVAADPAGARAGPTRGRARPAPRGHGGLHRALAGDLRRGDAPGGARDRRGARPALCPAHRLRPRRRVGRARRGGVPGERPCGHRGRPGRTAR